MILKYIFAVVNLFVCFYEIDVCGACSIGTGSNTIIVPGGFISDIKKIEENDKFRTISETRMLNILITPSARGLSVLLSGIRPILSADQKTEIMQFLKTQTKSEAPDIQVLDIFDISLNGAAKRIVDDCIYQKSSRKQY